MNTYRALDIAKYFLTKADPSVGDLISNLKLQKMCYYAQGVGLATRRTPMFDEKMEAWLHGPVVPSVYRMYSDYRAQAIEAPKEFDVSLITSADRFLLDDVYDYYGQYSAWRLRQMTHEESPWKDAYAEGENNQITNEALISYFDTQVSDEYRSKYEQEVRRSEA